MNNIDLKSQFGPGTFFKQMTKNDLSKNMVASFEQKSTQMDLNQESEKEKKLKPKKRQKENSDPYKEKKLQSSSNQNEKTKAQQLEKVKKIMNII